MLMAFSQAQTSGNDSRYAVIIEELSGIPEFDLCVCVCVCVCARARAGYSTS